MKFKNIALILASFVLALLEHHYRRAPLPGEPEVQYSIAATTAALIGLGISAAATTTSAVIGSKAAKSAANTQTAAADQIRQQAIDAGNTASATVNKAATDSTAKVDAATGVANDTLSASQAQQLAALKPYIDSGAISLTQLQQMLGPDGALANPKNQFSFTPQDYANDPSLKFLEDQQMQAQQRSAAANGSLLTGGFAKALNRNQAGVASTYLDSAFNRALQTYQTNRENTLTQIQGLQSLTGLGFNGTQSGNSIIGNNQGQIAANQLNNGLYAANTGLQAATYAGNTGLHAADTAAEAIGAGANAQAAGTVGSANAIAGGLNGVGNAALNTAYLYSLPPVTLPTKTNGLNINPQTGQDANGVIHT